MAIVQLVTIQKHANRQWNQQQYRFQPILDWKDHNSYENKQHRPQFPNDAPLELEDIEGGQQGNDANKEEDDS